MVTVLASDQTSKFYTSISQSKKKFHNLDQIKYIMEIWSLGKITGNCIHTCKLTEISRNILFQSNSQTSNSRKSGVKVSIYKSDFYTGCWNILDFSLFSQFNHKSPAFSDRVGSCINFWFKEQIFFLYKIWSKNFITTSW